MLRVSGKDIGIFRAFTGADVAQNYWPRIQGRTYTRQSVKCWVLYSKALRYSRGI